MYKLIAINYNNTISNKFILMNLNFHLNKRENVAENFI